MTLYAINSADHIKGNAINMETIFSSEKKITLLKDILIRFIFQYI